MEWLEKQHEAASRREPVAEVAVVAEASIPVHNKGKGKIVDHGRREKLQVLSISIGKESGYGYKGNEAIAQQVNHEKAKGEEKNGGSREAVA